MTSRVDDDMSSPGWHRHVRMPVSVACKLPRPTHASVTRYSCDACVASRGQRGMREATQASQLPAICAIALLACLIAGCGYTQSDYTLATATESGAGPTSRSLYRDDVRTVAVPIFTNRTFERNVEFDLSKAVVNYLESSTPYKVVPKERADTILEGEITRVDIDTVSQDASTSLPQEQLLTIRVNFTWKDLRTGRILAQRKHFDQSGTYYPTLGEGRFVGAQQNVERLAIAIVQEMQADW